MATLEGRRIYRQAPLNVLRNLTSQKDMPAFTADALIPVVVINDSTYPIETDAGAPDVTDRAARLLGIADVTDLTIITAGIESVANSTTRVTIATPTAGLRARVHWIDAHNSTTGTYVQVYFGTAAFAYAKAIFQQGLGTTTSLVSSISRSFPRGAEPVGAVNDVISLVTTSDIGTGVRVTLGYSEE